MRLYPYQEDLVNQARLDISKGAQGVMIQSPPGSGKSVVIATIAKYATDKGNHVLFIVHRKELVRQIEETFQKVGVDRKLSTIITVGKAVNRLDWLPEPSIIITDESHHARAATYRKIYDHYPEAIRLGFTATPWRMSGLGFRDIYDTIIHGQQVDWLIQNNFLAPFDYYAPTLSDMNVLKKSSTGDYTKASMDKAVSRVIFGDIVKHYRELADGKKTILYAHSVEASQNIAQAFTDAGIKAMHADAKTNSAERDAIMEDFKDGDLQVLCNVDLVSEGFNVPDCSCVILVRPTASLVLYLQQSMRSMRYQAGKKAIIIDHVGNYSVHGLPDTHREWSIDDKEKKVKKNNTDNEVPIKHCLSCQMVNPSNVRVCEGCGEEFPVENSEMEVRADAKLEKVDSFEFQVDYQMLNLKKEYADKKVEDLETFEDYFLYAKARNIKEAWIKFQHPTLKKMGWPEFYSHLKPLKEKYNFN